MRVEMSRTNPGQPTSGQPAPRQPASGQGRNDRGASANRIILIVGLSLVVIVTVVGLIFALNFRGGPVDQNADLAAGSRVAVDIPNAALSFRASNDDQVHVTMRGTYFGSTPTLKTRTSGEITTVSGGCSARWFSFCSLDVTIALPAQLPLIATGTNGAMMASGLTGELRLATTNGRIETDGTKGAIELRTTNGAIRVRGAASAKVTATTTNGSVELTFLEPPDDVVARSTNGSVTVRVPVDGVGYFVKAQTTNGTTNTDSVPGDGGFDRTIDVETTNGSVSVLPN